MGIVQVGASQFKSIERAARRVNATPIRDPGISRVKATASEQNTPCIIAQSVGAPNEKEGVVNYTYNDVKVVRLLQPPLSDRVYQFEELPQVRMTIDDFELTDTFSAGTEINEIQALLDEASETTNRRYIAKKAGDTRILFIDGAMTITTEREDESTSTDTGIMYVTDWWPDDEEEEYKMLYVPTGSVTLGTVAYLADCGALGIRIIPNQPGGTTSVVSSGGCCTCTSLNKTDLVVDDKPTSTIMVAQLTDTWTRNANIGYVEVLPYAYKLVWHEGTSRWFLDLNTPEWLFFTCRFYLDDGTEVPNPEDNDLDPEDPLLLVTVNVTKLEWSLVHNNGKGEMEATLDVEFTINDNRPQ